MHKERCFFSCLKQFVFEKILTILFRVLTQYLPMKKKIRVPAIAVLLFLVLFLNCQKDNYNEEQAQVVNPIESCGFYVDEQRVQKIIDNTKYLSRKSYNTITQVPVSLNIVRTDTGYSRVGVEEVNEQFSIMNNLYSEAGIEFTLCSDINFIDNSDLYYADNSDQYELKNLYNIDNVVNIYVTGSVDLSGSSVCGYAYYPGGPEIVFMDSSCWNNGSTLSHELGHFFGLVHTHGSSNSTNSTYELADGSNGSTAGDYVQDTPSDPKLTGYVNSSCNYTGSFLDKNGEPHNPDPTNLMSYSTKACRDFFSQGQLDRMNNVLNSSRSNLICENAVIQNGTQENPFIIESPLTANKLYGGVNCGEGELKYYLVDSDLDLNGFDFKFFGNKYLTVRGSVFGEGLIRASGCAEICVEGEIQSNKETLSGGIINDYCGLPEPNGTEENPFIIESPLTENKVYRNGDCETNEDVVYYRTLSDLDLSDFKLRMHGNVKLTVNGDVNGNDISRLVARRCAEICVSGIVNVVSKTPREGKINYDCGMPIGSFENPKILEQELLRNKVQKNGNCETETTKYFKTKGDLNVGEFTLTVRGNSILNVNGNVNGTGYIKAKRCGTINIEGNINTNTEVSSGGVIND